MNAELTTIAQQLGVLSSMFLPATSLSVRPAAGVLARAWQVSDVNVLLIVANSMTTGGDNVVVKLGGAAFSGTANVLFEQVPPVKVTDSVLVDTLTPYYVRVYNITAN